MEDKELKEAVASVMKDSTKRQELAELIVEWANPGRIGPDVISLLMNTRSLKQGDQLLKKVRKGIEVHTFVNCGVANL